MNELKKALKEKKVVIGTERVLKMLKNEKLSAVYLSKNCPEDVKNDVQHYAKLFNINVKETDKTNEELGVICKKPFSISVLGF